MDKGAKLYDAGDGKSVTVNTGQKTSVSPQGVFGAVTKFNEGELKGDLQSIKETLMAQAPEANVPESKGESGSTTSPIPIILIISAVAVIGGVSVLVIKRKRSQV